MNQLSEQEKLYSFNASRRLGYRVNVYFDGQWICEPNDPYKNGYGSTPEEAEADCKKNNQYF